MAATGYYYLSVNFVMWIVKQKIEKQNKIYLKKINIILLWPAAVFDVMDLFLPKRQTTYAKNINIIYSNFIRITKCAF